MNARFYIPHKYSFVLCAVLCFGSHTAYGQTFASFSASGALFSLPALHLNFNSPTETPLRWAQLTPQQRKILAPLAGLWDELDDVRKKKWLGIAERYPRLKPDQQEKLQARMVEWASMSAEQRRKAREQFALIKTVPNETKSRAWESYLQLSENERKKLAELESNSQKQHTESANSSAKKSIKKSEFPKTHVAHPAVIASAVTSIPLNTPSSPVAASTLLPSLRD